MASREPLDYPVFQAFDANGAPLSSGTVEFFDAGTTDQRDTYSDPDLTTTNPNPVTLNSRGEPESGGGTAINIYLDNQPYKMVLKDSSGSTIRTVDNYLNDHLLDTDDLAANGGNVVTDDRGNTFKETQVIENDTPAFRLNDTATTDLNLHFVLSGGDLSLQHRNDDGTLSKTITTFDLAAGNIDLADGGQLRAGSGFQGTPSFSFKDDPDTGIYRPSEDVIRVTTGGAWALEVGAGVLARGATGGDQGAGTINAEGVYDDGNLLTDYVFDAGIDGAVDTVKWDAEVPNRERVVEEADPETGKPERTQVEERTHEPAREFDLTETDPAAFAAKWKAERKLPAMKRLSDRVAARGGEKLGIGESLQALMETCEAQAVHIEKLRQEIEALKNG